MGRKNLLKDLMEAPAPEPDQDRAEPGDGPSAERGPAQARRAEAGPPRPRYVKGAIGAVGQTIAELKSRALAELDPGLIDAGGLADRLEHDAAEHAALMSSIRDYGQQVPVLVRPHPEAQGRYQIVYGRRRVLALRDLGLPVRALVRELDDRELVIAQGQENSARRDLSFIEKAHFARQMRDAGYDRKIVCDALHIDKTTVSRMLSAADRIPDPVIAAIGAAPGIGRDRWLKLADLLETAGWDSAAAALVAADPAAASSDARFESLMRALLRPARRRPAPQARPARAEGDETDGEGGPQAAAPAAAETPLRGARGALLGRARRRGGAVTLILDAGDEATRFADWLAAHMPEIHRDWKNRRGE